LLEVSLNPRVEKSCFQGNVLLKFNGILGSMFHSKRAVEGAFVKGGNIYSSLWPSLPAGREGRLGRI
jgi:hypothetical protein